MADNARGIHVSPGIYTREIDMNYAVRSLGITTLGLVGETQRGPAFQPMDISNWREFQEMFGGTSTEKFKGSQYPKYELPYIAKSYLTESEQLKVVRVLGLSGYNAGPAWVVTASKTTPEGETLERKAVAVIRSRGEYTYYNTGTTTSCQCENTKFDALYYAVGEKLDKISITGNSKYQECKEEGYNMNALQIREYIPFLSEGNECIGFKTLGGDASWSVSQTNKGRFKLVGVTGKHDVEEVDTIIESKDTSNGYFEYALSLNPYDKEYILNVLGTKAYDGEAPIYVESLYDVALEQAIANYEVDKIDSGLTIYNAYKTADYCHHMPIDGIVEIPQNSLTRKLVGRRYLASTSAIENGIKCTVYSYSANTPMLIRDYFETVDEDEFAENVLNQRPQGDFFTYMYRANASASGTMKTTVTSSDNKLYRKISAANTLNDVSGYTISLSVPKIVVETTTTAATPLNSSDFRWSISGASSATTGTVQFSQDPTPSYNYGLEENGLSSYTYYISAYTHSYSRTFTGVPSKVKAELKTVTSSSSHRGKTEKVDRPVSTPSYSSTTYTYGSQKSEYLPASTMTSDPSKVTGITSVGSGETQEFKDWADQVAETKMHVGQIYTVKQYTSQDGKRRYLYAYYDAKEVASGTSKRGEFDTTNLYGNLLNAPVESGNTNIGSTLVYNNADGLYYRMNPDGDDIEWVELDLNDYKSAYRYASTPWIVSNLKGDYKNIEMTKLFRFHTISDGDNANNEIKVSIENIRPDEGTFDVVVRRIDDLDESIIPLEKFSKCTMIPSDANYISYKIGSFDGVYESKSKFITVEVNETTAAKTSVPAGFLGYPIPKFNGRQIKEDDTEYTASTNFSDTANITFPTIKYNRFFDEDVKNRKQYFGLSSWVGVDVDNFMFKGSKTYINDPSFLSHGFHLDSRLDMTGRADLTNDDVKITVDGEVGYEFDSVSTNSRTQILDNVPVIGKEEEMYGSIFEYVNLRKFTVFFYGGFDGWDVYRSQRTNTDNFKMSQYRGYINEGSGEGYSFDKIKNPELLQLNQNGITSDWYAYLSGIRQFATPEATDINVFATPGIDYVNQKLLVGEAIEMIEEERADSIYVITTPDKPSGAGDYTDEMYTPEDAVYNLEDSEIDSNYSCTYYPWVKYLDIDNNQYIYLPPTKDAVRNFAQTDNQAYPWFAPAGVERGSVDCVRAKFITKLGDEDVLYDGRINPVKTFAQDGPKIWGQKNLQINESQLNRIAVRRLILRLRKLIAISCIGLIFEPNDSTTKQSFISSVTPILDSIRSNRGISDYRIEVNDSIESRERRELPAKIYFKPYNALEYITIDFILAPEGVLFDDI